jgi:hypothetical protein
MFKHPAQPRPEYQRDYSQARVITLMGQKAGQTMARGIDHQHQAIPHGQLADDSGFEIRRRSRNDSNTLLTPEVGEVVSERGQHS